MPCPCHAHAVPMPCPCRATKSLECVFPIWFTQCGRVWFTLAMPCSDHAVLLKATAQHVRRETVCGLPTRVRLLPATTRSSTKIIIRSIPISDAGGHCETKQCFSWTRKRMVAAHYKKKKKSVTLLDSQFGYFRLPRGLSRRLSEAYQSQMQEASVKPNNVCHGRRKEW